MSSVFTTQRSTSASYLPEVDLKIRQAFGLPDILASQTTVDEAFVHHFATKGKKTRAATALHMSEMLGLQLTDGISLSATVEALHNASLVQDDFQDGALTRRGQPTVSARYGRDVALALTTRLVSTAFVIISQTYPGKTNQLLTQCIHKSIGTTVVGQTRDLEDNKSHSLEELILIARQKSGPLFALSLELPLIASERIDAARDAYKAACDFGVGYQIMDDIKDYEIDKLRPSDSNVVNALTNEYSWAEALTKARSIAQFYLERSAQIAQNLPLNCGDYLQHLAEQKQKELKDSHD
jgi:geranylgeranyl diphosphate synthase type II